MSKFIGREYELKRLYEAAEKNTASFIVIKGRRRIGKSRLVEEFSKQFTKRKQLSEFSRQIAINFNVPFAHYQDWSDALWAVATN